MRLGRCQFVRHSLYLDILNSLSTVFALQKAQISLLCLSWLLSLPRFLFLVRLTWCLLFPIGYDACRLDSGFSVVHTCPVCTFVTLLLLTFRCIIPVVFRQLGRGGYVKTQLCLSYLLCWRRRLVSATLGHLQVTVMCKEENYTMYVHL